MINLLDRVETTFTKNSNNESAVDNELLLILDQIFFKTTFF